MKLSEYAIHKPITTIMTTLSFMVLGAISIARLPLEYLPDISFPFAYVRVSYPSSSPEEIQRAITRPIEEVLGTLPSVKAMSARSSSSSASVRIEFDLGTDMDLMSVHIRDRLDQVRNDLPDDVERVDIRRFNTDDWPIMNYALTWAGADQTELADIYKFTILPRLQRLEGVGSVDIYGMDEKNLLVQVDQALLNTHKLDIRTLNMALRTNNVNISAGYVNDANRRLAVRAVGEFQQIDQIRQLPLRNGLELGDVADVTYDYPEKTSFEHLDGRNAVSVSIRKSSTANLVATANRVKKEMEVILDEIGRDKLRSQIVRDSSISVTDGISSLTLSAMLGGLLAISVIFVFLRNFRSTLIIGSGIPISALCVFMIMYLLRMFVGSTVTLNLISMMGLMVSIGMLVDPAVVALENIYRKRFDDGQDAWTAALEGSREIGMPILAGALTTICVFIPIIFITDSRSAMFMKDFALTVCIAVVASLCVALTLVPLAASRAFQSGRSRFDLWIKILLLVGLLGAVVYKGYALGPKEIARWSTENAAWLLSGISSLPASAWVMLGVLLVAATGLYFRFRSIGVKGLYVRIITATLHYRWSTVAVACGLLVGGYYLYQSIEQKRGRFEPTRRVDVRVEVPRSFDIDDAIKLFGQVEDLLIPRKAELDIEAVSTRYSGRRSNRITLYLTPADQSTQTTDEVNKKVMALLPTDIPGVKFSTGGGHRGGGSTGVGVEIKGPNADVLAMLAEDIKLRLDGIPGVQEVETSLESGTEEIRVTVNRQRAQRYGLSPRQIATTIATALGGRGNSKFKTDDGEIDIQLQLKEEDRATLEQLKNAQFESQRGNLVSFASLAEFNLQKGPRSIEREDRMATVTIYASAEQNAVFRAGMMMSQRMQAIPLPSGYAWQMDRRFRWMSQEQGQDSTTMLFAVVLIYIIMASLFESYVHPFTIMFSIGFAFIGVAVGLYVFKVPMDSNANYGLLILFGIVVNNGIVLVDHINRYRKQGLFRRDAIVQGGQDRLRPITMTATTTILGLTPLVLPMVYGTAEGTAKRWGPIGLVVVCGLAISTVLTVILLPTIYSLMDDLAGYAKRMVASLRSA